MAKYARKRSTKPTITKKAVWRRPNRYVSAYARPRFGLAVSTNPVRFTERWSGSQEWYSAPGMLSSLWTQTGVAAGGASLAAWALTAQAQVGQNQGGFAVITTLRDVINYASFTALWDAYRIRRVTMRIECSQNSADAALNAVTFDACPSLTYAVDNDDGTTPANENAVLGKKSAKTHSFTDGKPVIISWTPKVAQALYGGGAFSSYGQASPWIDCANTTVEYYGMKLWWRNLSVPAIANSKYGSQIRIIFKLDVEFKDLVV